ncbi:hypothetical protein CAL25_12360 [Bordetella genomosp. 5]|uniref:Uncharacterized protein n=1 Tax=Bordetella genomosp. 5 TaxID=1395608 RepID=A0A261TNC7_9BORD|nr:hypothetical protein CAL25_12360 [Bordetella genomosp. 5]
MTIARSPIARHAGRHAGSPGAPRHPTLMQGARRNTARRRAVLIAVACVGVIGVMLASAARAGAMPALPSLPAATEVVVLGEGVRLFGAPARMAVFRSAHEVADLLDYVATRHPDFNQLHIEPQRITLAAVGGVCSRSISVAQVDGGGSVGSIASICQASMSGPGEASARRADTHRDVGTAEFALPSSELLLDVSFTEDEQEVQQQVWASPLSAQHLDQAFRRRLAAEGWQEEAPVQDAPVPGGPTSEARSAQHWRTGETLAYVINPTAAGGAGASGLWLRRTRPAGSQAGSGHWAMRQVPPRIPAQVPPQIPAPASPQTPAQIPPQIPPHLAGATR